MVSMMTYIFSARGFGHPVFLKPHFGHPVMKILAKTLPEASAWRNNGEIGWKCMETKYEKRLPTYLPITAPDILQNHISTACAVMIT